MTLLWPWALATLLAFPLLLAYRWWTRRRRRHSTVVFSNLALVRAALAGRPHWRRRVPLWLLAAGLAVLAVGAARPQASMSFPANSTSILLAIDVSVSMCSTDIEPNRIAVAREAARDFILAYDEPSRIGLVTFAGIAGVLVQPTTDKAELLNALDELRMGRGTAIGMAILASIDAIAEFNPEVAPTGVRLGDGPRGATQPDAIVLLTDGRNTHGVLASTAAAEAAARGVRVYTIGFGTPDAAPMVCTADQVGSDGAQGGETTYSSAFGGTPTFGGPGRYQQIDKTVLRNVAEVTGGEYYDAADAQALTEVLADLPASIRLENRTIELTAWFALGGALLVLAAVGLTQWWAAGRELPTLRRVAVVAAGEGVRTGIIALWARLRRSRAP